MWIIYLSYSTLNLSYLKIIFFRCRSIIPWASFITSWNHCECQSDAEEAPPVGDHDLDALEEHLARRNRVAGHFHAADAKATITLAERARNRIVAQPRPGMLVYYFRRSKGTKYQPIHAGYRGPARVIALEPSTVRSGTSVIWLSHGGNLIQCAPVHLRYATDLERTTYY